MLKKIISGGQTGADRASLDFAIARGIPHGGWCPRGRVAEDGLIDARYQLAETPSEDPAQRTEWNVRDADGTVIFSISPTLSGGSQKSARFASRYEKPLLHLCRERDRGTAAKKLSDFLLEHQIKTLNIAGPRASEEPEVAKFTLETLMKLSLVCKSME